MTEQNAVYAAQDLAYFRTKAGRLEKSNTELMTALKRANKLIEWMTGYIGKMAPGDYHQCYSDLNAHGIFMEKIAIISKAEGK